MKKNRRMKSLVVIDPCMVRPEIATYNMLGAMCGTFAKSSRFQIETVQYHLPNYSNERLKDMLASVDPVAVICLGSLANVTDNHKWVDYLAGDISEFIFEPGIPFLGICFAHQLLAHMFGCKVDYLKERHRIRLGKHYAYRRTQITHPKMRLPFASLNEHDYFSNNGIDLSFQEAILATQNWTDKHWRDFQHCPHWQHTALEQRVWNFIEEQTPSMFIAHARHEQEVHDTCKGPLVAAATSDECAIDALVHISRPVYSVQPHPETPHISGLGERLIRNFIYMSSLLREVLHK